MPAFYWTATWVTPKEPQFAVIVTASESFKKDYQLLDSNAIWVYDLSFSGVSDSGRNAMMRHYTGWQSGNMVGGGVTGPFEVFVWTSVPSYLSAGTTMSVRYVPGSFKEKPSPRHWDINMSFEKNI